MINLFQKLKKRKGKYEGKEIILAEVGREEQDEE